MYEDLGVFFIENREKQKKRNIEHFSQNRKRQKHACFRLSNSLIPSGMLAHVISL